MTKHSSSSERFMWWQAAEYVGLVGLPDLATQVQRVAESQSVEPIAIAVGIGFLAMSAYGLKNCRDILRAEQSAAEQAELELLAADTTYLHPNELQTSL